MPNEYLQLNKLSIGNNDGRYVELKEGDVLFAKERLDTVKKSIKKALSSKGVKNLAVMTHVPIFNSGIVTKDDASGYGWNLGTSFFYNLTFGNEIIKQDKLKLVVSGHTHGYREDKIQSPTGDVKYLVSGSDYEYPEFFNISLSKNGKSTFKRINFNGDQL